MQQDRTETDPADDRLRRGSAECSPSAAPRTPILSPLLSSGRLPAGSRFLASPGAPSDVRTQRRRSADLERRKSPPLQRRRSADFQPPRLSSRHHDVPAPCPVLGHLSESGASLSPKLFAVGERLSRLLQSGGLQLFAPDSGVHQLSSSPPRSASPPTRQVTDTDLSEGTGRQHAEFESAFSGVEQKSSTQEESGRDEDRQASCSIAAGSPLPGTALRAARTDSWGWSGVHRISPQIDLGSGATSPTHPTTPSGPGLFAPAQRQPTCPQTAQLCARAPSGLMLVLPVPSSVATASLAGPRQATMDLLEHTQQSRAAVLDGDDGAWSEGYDVVRCVGVGGLAHVFLAVHKETGSHVALKRIPTSRLGEDASSQLHREVMALKSLTHPNIIGLFGVHTSPKYQVVAIEYASGGDLQRCLQAHGGKLPEPVSKEFFGDVVCALRYCHDNGVCHRDIKPLNVLIVEEEGSTRREVAKLCDFGLSVVTPASGAVGHDIAPHASTGGGLQLATSPCIGTQGYMAPEVATDGFSIASSPREYNACKADVFSAGQTLHEMLCGRLAMPDLGGDIRLHRTAPASVAGLLSAMMATDPAKRPAIAAVAQHSWFADEDD